MLLRRLAILAALAIWAHCQAVFAQIEVAEVFEPGQKIEARFTAEPPAGATAVYAWSHDRIDAKDVEIVDGGRRILIWAPPDLERYQLRGEASYTIDTFVADPEFPDDPTKAKPTKLTWPPYVGFDSFLVTGAPEPGPTPPAKTLAELAGKDAASLAAFYVEFRTIVPLLSTSETLRVAHAKGLELKGLAATGSKAEIAKRFDQVVPAETTTLTDELRSSIDAMLAAIAEELGAKPPGPQPPPGPTPDDPWKVGEAVAGVASALSSSVKSQAPATAALFDEAAAGLESAHFPTINQAATWLQTERKKLWGSNAAEWSAVEGAVNEIWNQHWPMLKGDVINFYRAAAAGLRSVTNG